MPVNHYLATLRPSSAKKMRSALAKIAGWASAGTVTEPEEFPWQRLTKHHTEALWWTLRKLYAPETAKGRWTAVKGVLNSCLALGLISQADYDEAANPTRGRTIRIPVRRKRPPPKRSRRKRKAYLAARPKRPERPPRELARDELTALFAACTGGDPWTDARDAAALALVYGAGVRDPGEIEYEMESDWYEGIERAAEASGPRAVRKKAVKYRAFEQPRCEIRQEWLVGLSASFVIHA